MKTKVPKILVIDPDRLFVEQLTARLLRRGCDVESVEGITQGAQRFSDVRFDCVITDEELPEMKGHDAASVLKIISPGTPIIITATSNTLQRESKIREQDIFYYHVKSFDINELEMAVLDALRKVKKQDVSS
ncbi:MAG: response regulator [Planctomycetota bacterium]|jgi:DNA-binding NtrC family response regulator